jgi:hypothetical protein
MMVTDMRSRYDTFTNKYHPAPEKLSRGGRALMNRNVCQILGLELDKPSHAVIAWTQNAEQRGGTGQALRIATDHSIPIINMGMIEFASAKNVIAELNSILVSVCNFQE